MTAQSQDEVSKLMLRIDGVAETQFFLAPEKFEKYKCVLRGRIQESISKNHERFNALANATDEQVCKMLEGNIARIPAIPKEQSSEETDVAQQEPKPYDFPINENTSEPRGQGTGLSSGGAILATFGILVFGLVLQAATSFPIIVILVLATSIWAAWDARKIGLHKYKLGGVTSTATTLLGCLLLWIICFPWYLVNKGKIQRGEARLKEAFATQAQEATNQQHVTLQRASSADGTPLHNKDERKLDFLQQRCKSCGNPFSSFANTCPHCNHPTLGKLIGNIGVGMFKLGCSILILLFALPILWAIFTSSGNPKTTNSTVMPTPQSIPASQNINTPIPEQVQTTNSRDKDDAEPIPASPITVKSRFSPEARCRAIAQREYPNDPQLQQFTYNQQIAAYRYMASIEDTDVKQIALREYPEDFALQKFTYDQQSAAKRYMTTVTDAQVKQIALREYSSDYSLQKFTYDQQFSAKQYMAAMPNSPQKQQAIREYPYDYSLQKFTYDQSMRGR